MHSDGTGAIALSLRAVSAHGEIIDYLSSSKIKDYGDLADISEEARRVVSNSLLS